MMRALVARRSAVGVGLVGALLVGLAGMAQAVPDAAPAPAREASSGSDFNGDGFSDLAVTVGPGEADGVVAVVVLYGSRNGLQTSQRQRFEATDFGRPLTRDDPEEPMGGVLATGNFDGDRYDDLVMGEPAAWVGEIEMAGAVRIVYGSRQGLDLRRSQLWSQRSRGVPGKAEDYDAFGDSLAVGNFGRGSEDDLAIGVTSESTPLREAGAVSILYGSSEGLVASGSQIWSGATVGVPGVSEEFAMFADELAAGRFSDSGYDDLAIGIPAQTVAGEDVAGSVVVLRGSRKGLTVCGSRRWTQDSPGIAGRSQGDDAFGDSLAVGQFGRSGFEDLAIGVPGETVGRIEQAGAVNVLYGSAGGLSASGNQIWTQRSRGVAGRPESADEFGMTLAAANLGRDTGGKAIDDLVITADESIGEVYRAGQVHVLFGRRDGLSSKDSRVLTPGTSGVTGPRMNDEFGSLLAVGDFGSPAGPGYADLAAQISDDEPSTTGARSGLHVFYGVGLGPAGAQQSRVLTLPTIGEESTDKIWAMAGD